MCAVVVEQLDAVSCAVAAQGSDLCLGVGADVRQAAVGLRGQGRSGMVERGLGQLGTTGAQAARVELGESLRRRSEEHTSELQSLMRISYAVFCLKKKKIRDHV